MVKCGIYKIENLITHHIYIGQSTNIDTRWRRHKDDVHSGKKDYPLYRAINKYGIDNFSFEIIEECSKEALDEREQFWIKYYNSYKDGYNQTTGGQGAKCCGSSLNYKQVETIREELRKTYKTNIEIANEYKVSENIISGINTGYYWYEDDVSYPIRLHNFSQKARSLIAQNQELTAQDVYTDKQFQQTEHFCSKCGAKLAGKTKTGLCHKCACEKRRVVERPSADELYQLLKDNNGNFTLVGNLYKMDGNAIRKWCMSYGIPFHSKDYRPPKEEKIKQPNPALPKPVAKLDLNTGAVLATYSSIEEAQKINHVFHVGRVCSGERYSSGGFGWKFI